MRFSSLYPPKLSTYNTSQNTQPCFRTLRSHAAYTADYIKDAIVLPENASSINVCISL